MLRNIQRSGPLGAAQRLFWDRTVASSIDARAFDFVATTSFGARIEGNTRDYIQRHICLFGVWEPAITNWITATLKAGDTFIDAGANIGYYSLLASKLVGPAGSVVALEASPTIFALLERNLANNDADNVRALNIAVSDHAGMLDIYEGPAANIGKTTTIPDGSTVAQCSVPALSLVDACGEDLLRARIIKIDVEGAECSVVSGLQPALEKLRPDCEVVIELSPWRLPPGHSVLDVIGIFGKAGFRPYVIENEYHALAYIAPRFKPRKPLRLPIRDQADVVFSRSPP